MTLLLALALLLLASVFTFWADRLLERLQPLMLPLPAAVAFGLLAIAGVGFLRDGEIVGITVSWVPYLDLDFALGLGGVGLLMSLLITGIGALILLYASSYMHGNSMANRLYAYLYGFMFSMTGLVLADHLVL